MKTHIRTNMTWQTGFALTFVASLWLALAPATVRAQSAAAAKQSPKVRIDFKETTLKNGLRVITVEDHHAPVVSVALTYNVGARDERQGRTGFAHLFEHMLFQGSQNVRPGEHMNLILNHGGLLDATTGTDRTIYFQTVPANQLELPLFLEADRMRSLSITQASLDTERNVVQEERRQRIDNQPYGKSREVLNGLLYDSFAYKHPGIGSMEDLNAASLADIQQFFKTYYAPNNVVLVLVGDFSAADALAKINQHFGDIPRQPDPPAVDASEPERNEERRATVEDKLARVPQVSMAFKAVPGNTADFYALEILSAALQKGQSSRLYQKLVKEKELVGSVGGFTSEGNGPGAFYISATLRPGKKTEEVEAAIYAEIERLQQEPLTDAELQKASNSVTLDFITSIQRSLLRAFIIGQYAVYYHDPNLINTRLDKTAAVTKEDVRRVANKYLRSTNRVVVITIPKAATGGAGQ